MSVQYAHILAKSAPLEGDFARRFVVQRFGADAADLIYNLLPRYSRGPRKGQVKGYILWDKVEVGGWRYSADGRGCVERPGTRNVRIAISRDTYNNAKTFGERGSWSSNLTEQQWLETVDRAITAITTK